MGLVGGRDRWVGEPMVVCASVITYVHVTAVGIGASEPMKLVMELAPLGPMNKYLRKQ